LVDLAPTTLALVGLPIPRSYEGRPLLEPRPGLARFQTDHNVLKLGMRQGHWKFLLDTEHDRAQLFDLGLDAREQHDVATDHADRVARYRRHVLDWSEAQRVNVREFAKRGAN
jgi:arylsulfatase A-like enzyme